MKKSLYKTCPRCNGSGVYCNGRCFGCDGAGRYLADKFLRNMGTKGLFFGITGDATKGKQSKSITRAESAEKLAADLMAGATFKEITEEQARKFFKRYGVRTEISV